MVKPLKDRKGKTVLYAFIEIVNESNGKPNKLWVDRGREFYNKLMQEWLDNNDILIHSTHNEGKLVIAERFIKTLNFQKMAAYKFIASLNKSVDQNNNIYHHSINKQAVNADYSTFTEKIETNHKAPKFKVNDRVRITKYENIFSKGYT